MIKGKYTCVLSPITAGVFAHESFGHKSEADFMIGDESMIKEWKIGSKVGSDILIGVAGTLGDATEETWKEAEKNLENKVPYKFELCKDKKRTIDLRKSNLTAEEFFNDLDLEYKNIDKYFEVDFAVKDKDSVNVFDTGIAFVGREFDIENILKDVKNQLGVYKNEVELPNAEKMPIVMTFGNFNGKILEALKGDSLGRKSSIFTDKIGEKAFLKDFTVYLDGSDENI